MVGFPFNPLKVKLLVGGCEDNPDMIVVRVGGRGRGCGCVGVRVYVSVRARALLRACLP